MLSRKNSASRIIQLASGSNWPGRPANKAKAIKREFPCVAVACLQKVLYVDVATENVLGSVEIEVPDTPAPISACR